MTTSNHNNELNAQFHRNAVRDTMHALRNNGDAMRTMLDMDCWNVFDEERYDELYNKQRNLIAKLKTQGMFIQ